MRVLPIQNANVQNKNLTSFKGTLRFENNIYGVNYMQASFKRLAAKQTKKLSIPEKQELFDRLIKNFIDFKKVVIEECSPLVNLKLKPAVGHGVCFSDDIDLSHKQLPQNIVKYFSRLKEKIVLNPGECKYFSLQEVLEDSGMMKSITDQLEYRGLAAADMNIVRVNRFMQPIMAWSPQHFLEFEKAKSASDNLCGAEAFFNARPECCPKGLDSILHETLERHKKDIALINQKNIEKENMDLNIDTGYVYKIFE